MIVFDIETGPLPEEELRAMMAPEEPPFDPGSIKPFDPGSVKYGNTKDPVKRAEKLEECRSRHEEESANAERNYEIAKAERRTKYESDFISSAALNAMTCRILAIGYRPCGGKPVVKHGDGSHEAEADLLKHFWAVAAHVEETSGLLIGHNIKGFDLPRIIQRSWLHRISPPVRLLDKTRYWKPFIVDTMELWQLGNRMERFISLDALARFFGVGAKNGDGAMFSKMFLSSDPAERQKAIEYAANDVEMNFHVAVRMGVLSGE